MRAEARTGKTRGGKDAFVPRLLMHVDFSRLVESVPIRHRRLHCVGRRIWDAMKGLEPQRRHSSCTAVCSKHPQEIAGRIYDHRHCASFRYFARCRGGLYDHPFK